MAYLLSIRRILHVGILSGLLLGSMVLDIPQAVRAIDRTPIPVTAQLSNDPASWPVITAGNAKYLTLAGVVGHGRNTQALWAGDGHTIIVGGATGVWLYDSRTSDVPPRTLDTADLTNGTVILSHDGESFAVLNKRIRVWDIATGTMQLDVPAARGNAVEEHIGFSQDDTQLFEETQSAHCCYPDGSFAIWSLKTSQLLITVSERYLTPLGSGNMYPSVIRAGARSQVAALIDTNGDIQLWSIPLNTLGQELAASQRFMDVSGNQLVTTQPDKNLLALNWPGHWLWLFDLNKRALIDAIDTSASPTLDATIGPDGITHLVIEDGVVKLRDLQTDDLKATLSGAPVKDFAFSYDDRLVALIDGSAIVNVLDVATGRLKFTLIGHTAPVLHVAFSSDGKWIATVGDQTVRLWDVTTGQQHRVWGPGSQITNLAFSLDSTMLAASSLDRQVRIWYVDTGRLYTALDAPNELDTRLAFHPNGTLSIYTDTALWQSDWKHSEEHQVPFSSYAVSIDSISPDGMTTMVYTPIYGTPPYSLALFDNASSQAIMPIDDGTHRGWFAYNPNGQLLSAIAFYSGYNGESTNIEVIRLTDLDVVGSSPMIVGGLIFDAFSAGGRIIAVINAEGELTLCRVDFPPFIQF